MGDHRQSCGLSIPGSPKNDQGDDFCLVERLRGPCWNAVHDTVYLLKSYLGKALTAQAHDQILKLLTTEWLVTDVETSGGVYECCLFA